MQFEPSKTTIRESARVMKMLLQSLSCPETSSTAHASTRDDKGALFRNLLMLLLFVGRQTLDRQKRFAAQTTFEGWLNAAFRFRQVIKHHTMPNTHRLDVAMGCQDLMGCVFLKDMASNSSTNHLGHVCRSLEGPVHDLVAGPVSLCQVSSLTMEPSKRMSNCIKPGTAT